MLKINNLSKSYGTKKAVDDLTLHIAPREIYGFIGHNGAGKTTTIKAVCGILGFDEGEIFIDGESVFRGYSDIATVDTVHPGDVGFMLMARAVTEMLKRAITQKFISE